MDEKCDCVEELSTNDLMGTERPENIEKQCVVNASRSEVWKAWTTTDGIKSFFAPQANIELRLNGPYELYFMLENEPGLRGSEGCKVLSFLPEEMLSFTWNLTLTVDV